jgi:hypothetical protein
MPCRTSYILAQKTPLTRLIRWILPAEYPSNFFDGSIGHFYPPGKLLTRKPFPYIVKEHLYADVFRHPANRF